MSAAATIPDWNPSGIIPPIRPGEAGHSPERSPYRTTLLEVINRFGSSPARLDILEGFLTFRGELHHAGLVSGIQWLNGSFVENKEARAGVAPADIDVVTFAHPPPGKSQADLLAANPNLFNHSHVKASYKVDSYFQFLGQPSHERFVRQTSYWNSMWSHTRNLEWKGFLEVDLAPHEDADVRSYLSAMRFII
jgi:hypothetical protein